MCSTVCKPFAPSDTWGNISSVEVFEFVGVLRVDVQGGDVVLVLIVTLLPEPLAV
jgi:hypothetical protein